MNHPLDPITAKILNGAKHGFFTRLGGVSTGVFSALNCGFGSSDTHDNVCENRTRVARHMGVDDDHLITIHQTHSARAHLVDGPIQAGIQADALVTNRPGHAIAILTADCQPVLFFDPKAKVIGAAHAGWRGCFDGIIEATLDQMESLGADRAMIRAAIGPCISQKNYEIGAEFYDRFVAQNKENKRFFIKTDQGKYLFDLPGYGLVRLRDAGITQTEHTGHCTYADETQFFSYRRCTHRNQADYGRLISAICL
jgi:YfiH family protein